MAAFQAYRAIALGSSAVDVPVAVSYVLRRGALRTTLMSAKISAVVVILWYYHFNCPGSCWRKPPPGDKRISCKKARLISGPFYCIQKRKSLNFGM